MNQRLLLAGFNFSTSLMYPTNICFQRWKKKPKTSRTLCGDAINTSADSIVKSSCEKRKPSYHLVKAGNVFAQQREALSLGWAAATSRQDGSRLPCTDLLHPDRGSHPLWFGYIYSEEKSLPASDLYCLLSELSLKCKPRGSQGRLFRDKAAASWIDKHKDFSHILEIL